MASRAVSDAIEDKVGLVTICLDRCLVKIDTCTTGEDYGWDGSARGLKIEIEPTFTSLIPALIKKGIRVAVVTYCTEASII